MKKIALTLLAGMLLLGMLAACRREPESLPPGADIGPPSSQASDTSGTSASSTVSGESATSASTASIVSEPLEEHSITGTIEDVSVGQVFVMLETGQSVAFEYTTADIDDWTDTKPGSKVRVYYTGTLDGNDTSNITVTRIETIDD